MISYVTTIIICFAYFIWDFPATSETRIKIESIEPTVFLKKHGDDLMHALDMKLTGVRGFERLELRVKSGNLDTLLPIQSLRKGENIVRFYIPEIRDTTTVDFKLTQSGKKVAFLRKKWEPMRRWDIYLVHSSHHDLGYTDLPDRVLEEHKAHITKAIEYCEETEDWPEDSRFHYVIEQAWSALYFLEHTKDEKLKNRFIHYLKNGQLELTGLFGNQNTDLCASEELNRLVYPSFLLSQKFGIDIKTAETNDMPGINWGLVTTLHSAGIKYLYAGIQDYFNWGSSVPAPWDEEKVMKRDIPGAFYWQGPGDDKVLFWYGGGSLDNIWIWNYEQAEAEIANYLSDQQKKGYKYDQSLIRVLGGYRDNSLPDIRHSEIVKAWNEKWAYPRIKFSTNKQFFGEFEKKYGNTLTTIKGDFNPTDYNIGAISTPTETGYYRSNQRLVTTAETFSSLAAHFTDYTYPRDQINESYERIFLYNEHCWGLQHPSGPAQMAANSQKANNAFQAAALIEDIKVKALNKLSDQISLEEDGYHVVVYNPLAQSRSDVVSIPAFSNIPISKPFFREQRQIGNHLVGVWRAAEAADRKLYQIPAEFLNKPFRIVDISTGDIVKHQIKTIDDPLSPLPDASSRFALGRVSQNSQGGLNYQKNQVMDILFVAEDVPALGYKVFRLEADNHITSGNGKFVQDSSLVIENGFYRLSIEEDNLKIYDKDINRNIVDEKAGFNIGELLIRSVSDASVEMPGRQEISISDRGPVFSSVLVKSSYEKAPIIYREITVYHDVKRIDVATRFLKDSSPFFEYYVGFPFSVNNPDFRIESVNSTIEPITDQLPGTNTDAYTLQKGISVFNDEFTINWNSHEAPVIRIGDLWPGYVSQAHHGKAPLNYKHDFVKKFNKSNLYSLVSVNNFRTNFSPSYAGDMLFRYSFSSYSGTYDPQRSQQYLRRSAYPLIPVIIFGPQQGNFGNKFSFVEIDKKNIALVTIKAAEDGKGMVLRVMETAGVNTISRIKLNKIFIEEAFLANLYEEQTHAPQIKDGQINISFKPFEIKTVRVSSRDKFPVSKRYFYSY